MSDKGEDDGQLINIRNQASLSLAGNFADAAISFLGLILFANILGADGLGKFYIVLAIVKVALFPVAGIGQSVMKRGSEQDFDPAIFFGGGLVYGVAYAFTVGGVVAVVVAIEPELLQYSLFIVGGAFAVFFSRVFYILLLDTYRSRGKTGFATLTDNVHGIVETGVQVVFLLAGLNVVSLLAGTTLTTVVVTLVLFAISNISISRPSVESLHSIGRFARWSVLKSGLGTVHDRIPVLVLGFFLGEVTAGYYTSAMRLLMLGSYVGASIAPALMVRVSAAIGVGGDESPLENLQLSTTYAAILAIPIMFGSFSIPNSLMMTIFGPSFGGTGTILAVLSIYHVLNTYNTVADSFFDGIGQPDFSMKTTAIALFIRVALIIVLLGQYEIRGIIIAVVMSHAARSLLVIFLLRSEFNQTVIPTRAIYQLVSGALMWVVVTFLASIYAITGWLSLIIIVGSGAAIYVGVIIILDKYFRHMIINLSQNITHGTV